VTLSFELFTDGSGRPVGPIFKSKVAQVTLKIRTDYLEISVNNCKSPLRNISEEKRSEFKSFVLDVQM
jgi:hypothetical protein